MKKTPQVIGAGLPRTATNSLGQALVQLLGGKYYMMSTIPGHPFNLGEGWEAALRGETPDWEEMFAGYTAVLDWPASLFWQSLSQAYPEALVLLSVRQSAEVWYQSCQATILPVARLALKPDWQDGCGLVTLFERFASTPDWDDPAVLMAAYDRHNAAVRQAVPPGRLLEWRSDDGWAPLCQALGVPLPDQPFPWVSRREDWG